MLDQNTPLPLPDPVAAFLRHLETGNDVIRTGAVRAMAAQSPGDARVREALLACLLDEDPDVRGDAMTALVALAQPEDAGTIRRSLQGDPVREVKQAAIHCLSALHDADSVDLLRGLVLSRMEDQLAWEDENDAWDDWLDIQVAAIGALGALRVETTIADMLSARDDEFGQNLDNAVFEALARMGSEGTVWLLSIAQTEPGLARKRALEALAGADSAAIAQHLGYILADERADVRRLAVPLLAPTDPRARALVLDDPDAELRCAALKHFGGAVAEYAERALTDASETVQATALDMLPPQLAPELEKTVLANAIAWLGTAGAGLAAAAARLLARITPEQAVDPLIRLARGTARPLDARIAAAKALARFADVAATERLISLLSNESQQIRTVALTALADRARDGDQVAANAIVLAMEGALLAPEVAVVSHADEDGADLSAKRSADPVGSAIRISEDGEIVEAGPEPLAPVGSSTLASIQSLTQASEPEPLAEDTPEESSAKRRRRRAVEGPDEVALDLQRVALLTAGDLPQETVDDAVCALTESGDHQLRLAAFQALDARAAQDRLSAAGWAIAETGLADPHPPIRSVAAQALSRNEATRGLLAARQADEDALVREIAVRAMPCDAGLLPMLADPALIVRSAALERILAAPDDALLSECFETLLTAERIDTLGAAVAGSAPIRALAVERLALASLPPRQVHVLLEALAQGQFRN